MIEKLCIFAILALVWTLLGLGVGLLVVDVIT